MLICAQNLYTKFSPEVCTQLQVCTQRLGFRLFSFLLHTHHNEAKMQSWRCTVFMITFANYAMAHVARKCDTNVT